MERNGSLVVWVTTSRAQIPVDGATVVVALPQPDGRFELMSLLITDESGRAGPVTLPSAQTGDGGQTPGGPQPYVNYSMWVEHPNYEVAFVESFQVFPGVESVQQIDLLPLARPAWDRDTVSPPINAPSQPL